MDKPNEIVKTISIPALKANVVTFAIFIPAYLLIRYLFIVIWGQEIFKSGMEFIYSHVWSFIIIFVVGIVVHEGLHGLCWAFHSGFKSIKYGIKWLYLMPYCHCNKPMKRNAFLIGCIMPGIVLGLIPLFVGYITANSWLTLLGVVFLGAAGGDILVAIKLLKVNKEYFVEDQPDERIYYSKLKTSAFQQRNRALN